MRRSASMMMTEPPQPPQKQILLVGRSGGLGPGQPVADAEAQRHAQHQIDPVPLLLEDQLDRGRRQQPDPVDLAAEASADWMRATERALPWPLARRCRRAASRACWPRSASTTGPAKVRTRAVVGSSARRSNGSGGGGTTVRDPPPVGSPRRRSGSRRPAARRSPRRRTARCCPVMRRITSPTRWPVVERVVAGCGSRLPPGRLGGQPGGGLLPVVDVLDGDGLSQPDTPEVCDMRWRTSIPPCRWRANSGQYLATGASRSSSPRSTSISAARLVIVLVVRPHVGDRVSAHGHRAGLVAEPPHMSITISPSMSRASDAPSSSPESRFGASAARTPSNCSAHCPGCPPWSGPPRQPVAAVSS